MQALLLDCTLPCLFKINGCVTCRAGGLELWRAKHRRMALFMHSVIVGSAVLALSCIIDRVFYGR